MDCRLMLAILFVVVLVIVWKKTGAERTGPGEKTERDEKDVAESDPEGLEDAFFSEIGKGKKAYRIASVFNQFDILLLKSLLQSANIPAYFQSETSIRIRVAGIGKRRIAAFLNVVEEDYDDAVSVLEEFRENKRKINRRNENGDRDAVREILEESIVPSSSEDSLIIHYRNGRDG